MSDKTGAAVPRGKRRKPKAEPPPTVPLLEGSIVPGFEPPPPPILPKPPKPGPPPALVQQRIQELMDLFGHSADEGIAGELILQSLKMVRDQSPRAELKIMATAVRELRRAFNVFRPYRNILKVTIFGSARAHRDSPEYKQALKFSSEMVRRGFMVITGGGPGIMEAGHGGAGRERSFGVNIRLPFEQKANPIIEGDEKLINFRYFFTRKLMFVREAGALALFPGGFGTHDEGFEALTLVQTGKAQLVPLVFIDRPGGHYWRAFADYVATHMLKPGYIDEDDMALFKVTDDVEFACQEICNFYRRFHSHRYVNGTMVMRLQSPLPPGVLDRLNGDYADILAEGRMECVPALPEEADEADIASLPRLRFVFNRRNFGRLRQMVDEVNRA